MSNIQRLREIGSFSASRSWYSDRDERFELIETLLWEAEEVHTEFSDGGRWSNYETTVYKLEEDGEVAYFQTVNERPATESQEGMDCWFEFEEVEPYQVTITKYRGKN
jgi:hypothetical protein